MPGNRRTRQAVSAADPTDRAQQIPGSPGLTNHLEIVCGFQQKPQPLEEKGPIVIENHSYFFHGFASRLCGHTSRRVPLGGGRRFAARAGLGWKRLTTPFMGDPGEDFCGSALCVSQKGLMALT